jgi:hypothetical protein
MENSVEPIFDRISLKWRHFYFFFTRFKVSLNRLFGNLQNWHFLAQQPQSIPVFT